VKLESETPLLPDAAEIRRDLEHMTARWGELSEPAKFEIRAFKEGAQPQTATFSPDPEWMQEAVDWAENMNGLGYNIYAVRNPIRATKSGSASDQDIIASFFLWADCDDDASAGNIKKFSGPQYTSAVVTGRTPTARVHTYWALKEPCTDLAAWRDMQMQIARHFGSDKTVINPSRIMRVGGTVSYPDKKKQQRGYSKEFVTIRTEYPEAREPVTLDQMRRVFGASAPATKALDIDTGPQPLDRERLSIQAMAGQEWHHAVIRLVASYVSKGLSDGEIHALTDPLTLAGYTVEETRREVQTAIDGARRKGWTPEADYQPHFDHSPASPQAAPESPTDGQAVASWRVQKADAFTADFVAPEYLIEGVIQRGRLYTFTAPTGSGKTAVMLYAATAISTGNTFCEREVEHGDVLFLAGENPDDVRARVIATMDFYGIDPKNCRLHFIAGTFSIRQDIERLKTEAAKLPNLVMVVVDTFAAYFDGEDENSNAQALDFARVVRKLTALPSKPAVVMPAHPVKNASRDNLAPKGGSSLVNEVDGNLTLWNSDGALAMHWQVKHRGADFEPLKMELELRECDLLKDRKGRLMPTILAKPLLEIRAIQIARETLKIEDQLLLNIADGPDLSARERQTSLAISSGTYTRTIDRLCNDKLIRKFRRKWELTKNGERAVDEISGGEKQPLEAAE